MIKRGTYTEVLLSPSVFYKVYVYIDFKKYLHKLRNFTTVVDHRSSSVAEFSIPKYNDEVDLISKFPLKYTEGFLTAPIRIWSRPTVLYDFAEKENFQNNKEHSSFSSTKFQTFRFRHYKTENCHSTKRKKNPLPHTPFKLLFELCDSQEIWKVRWIKESLLK